tara:strand:+ start:2095 stop:2688 length:594 start_codon:yes stop_codon:yes gene_type:complete
MKTLELFVIELEKPIHDEITLSNGAKIYLDSKYNEFEWRVTEGPVVSPPIKHDTGVEVGDTLYFHHLVVMNEGQVLTGHDNHYLVRYHPDHTINNQAIAYKSKKSGHIYTLGGWGLIKPVFEQEPESELEVIRFEEKSTTRGVVAFNSPFLEELNVKAGDVVGFRDKMQYKITIDDVEYYRVRKEDLLYAEEEVHND